MTDAEFEQAKQAVIVAHRAFLEAVKADFDSALAAEANPQATLQVYKERAATVMSLITCQDACYHTYGECKFHGTPIGTCQAALNNCLDNC